MQQQRQLRLGDILDDYCPRERRLANHTVVAMVGDEVRLTRCTTCETEHPYKNGKVPRQRKKTPVQAAYDEVLESVKKDTETPTTLVTHPDADTTIVKDSVEAAASAAADAEAVMPIEDEAPAEAIRLHRPLIRASLPRVEAPAARPIPEFTIRQASRQGRFQNPRAARFAQARNGANANNQGNSRGQGSPQGARQGGRPQGHGAPGRPGQGQGRQAGQNQNSNNKKRSR
jgi:hypothetical protein